MFQLKDRVPEYLLGKQQMISAVSIMAFFSLAGGVFYLPFRGGTWFTVGNKPGAGLTILFFLASMTWIIASRILMYHTGKKGINYFAFICWNLSEPIAIGALFSGFAAIGNHLGLINYEGNGTLFLNATLYCLISFGIPYILVYQFMTIEGKNRIMKMVDYENVVSDARYSPQEQRRITLTDNNGAMKLSISEDNLYFIESDDNYVHVWYTDSTGGIKQYMLRCRLKTIEESFSDTALIRCHRKYIININKVEILTSQKDGYYADLGIEAIGQIPVSKTYESQFLNRFNSR